MHASLLLIMLGIFAGAYGTLVGAGGGFVMMPILILLYKENPNYLTGISLAVIFFNALSGTWAYARMKRIDYKSGALFAACTMPGAIFGALSTGYTSRSLFNHLFGALLIIGALFLILKPTPRPRSVTVLNHSFKRRLLDCDGHTYEYSFNPWLSSLLSVLVGYVASFLGIGGGIIHVPLMIYLFNFPTHLATATSHFVLVITALSGTLAHLFNSDLNSGIHRIVLLTFGVIPGAQIGAFLSQRIRGIWIVRSLALALGLVGIRILCIQNNY